MGSGRNWSSSNTCPHYLHVSKGSHHEQRRKSDDTIFPIISLWGISRRSRADNSVVCGPIWPKFELVLGVCTSLLPTNLKWIRSKATEKSRDIDLIRSRAANSVVSLQIMTKFELIQAFMYMYVLITCRYMYHEDRIINSLEEVDTLIFFIRSRAANSVVSLQIMTKFDLIQAFMYVFITCKYHEDQIINNREEVETSFFPL